MQDKPRGTMLEEGFVEGVRWVLERGWVFELGIDLRSGGEWQGEEAVEMLGRVFAGDGSGEGWVVVGSYTALLLTGSGH